MKKTYVAVWSDEKNIFCCSSYVIVSSNPTPVTDLHFCPTSVCVVLCK
jgi:hypothetical protein